MSKSLAQAHRLVGAAGKESESVPDDNGQREGNLHHLTTELIQMAEDYRLAANSAAYENIALERYKLRIRIWFALKDAFASSPDPRPADRPHSSPASDAALR